MTRTNRATEFAVEPPRAAQAWVTPLRDAVALAIRAERVQSLDPEALRVVQSKLGYGSTYGIWEMPEHWAPPGIARNLSRRRIDFAHLLKLAGAPDGRLDAAVLCLTRYAILLALVPVSLGRSGGRYLKPSSLSTVLRAAVPVIIAIGAQIGAHRSAGEQRFFGAYTRRDWLKLPSKTARTAVATELQRARQLGLRGLWSDVPAALDAAHNRVPDVRGDDPRPTRQDKARKWQPLPDDYVAQAGARALWLMKELGPSLLDVARALVNISKDCPMVVQGIGRSAAYLRRATRVAALLREHEWRDTRRKRIESIPFEFVIQGKGKRELMTWPPTDGAQVMQLLRCLQMAHLWITLLSVGSRIGELLSMGQGAVVRSSDGMAFANGRTFKIVSRIGGAQRDWPLPDVAVQAIAQQEKLALLVTALGTLSEDPSDLEVGAPAGALWLRVGSRAEITSDVNDKLRDAMKSLGLTTQPGAESLHTHRLRKSVARLAALAIVGAPKILMDLFGHKSIEMTLHYILSDPDVQAEIREVSQAQIIMMAQTAIANVELNGGPAAKVLKRVVAAEKARLGVEYGAQTVRELAEILTLSGRQWALVRPGVICTKLPGSSGPCTKNAGRPEPARCHWSCEHRLEEAVLKDDVDRSIEQAVHLHEQERAEGNEIQAEFWAGQVLAHVRRFDTLNAKWKDHPTVVYLLGKPAPLP